MPTSIGSTWNKTCLQIFSLFFGIFFSADRPRENGWTSFLGEAYSAKNIPFENLNIAKLYLGVEISQNPLYWTPNAEFTVEFMKFTNF